MLACYATISHVAHSKINIKSVIRQQHLFTFKNNQFIELGPGVRLQEALTTDFIARNTTIRIPLVLDVFTIRGKILSSEIILMDLFLRMCGAVSGRTA